MVGPIEATIADEVAPSRRDWFLVAFGAFDVAGLVFLALAIVRPEAQIPFLGAALASWIFGAVSFAAYRRRPKLRTT